MLLRAFTTHGRGPRRTATLTSSDVCKPQTFHHLCIRFAHLFLDKAPHIIAAVHCQNLAVIAPASVFRSL